MIRQDYFNYIEKKLNFLSYRIKIRSKINLLELNIHSENFFANLLNLIFGKSFMNMNAIKQNSDGIDLIDSDNKVVAQITSTNTKEKVENSLKHEKMQEYAGYSFIFVLIANEVGSLRTKTYSNPYGLNFDPQEDIYDITSLLRIIENLADINQLRKLYDLVRNELGEEADIVKVDTNLATILNILAEENLSEESFGPEINSFELEKKIDYNNLQSLKTYINDYAVYYGKVNEKYSEFDKAGNNKSLSILNMIKKEYLLLKNQYSNENELFFEIICRLENIVRQSKNYREIEFEELDMCIGIITVDAFVKCKIFENPEGYKYAVAR